MEKINALVIQEIARICLIVIGDEEAERTPWQEDKIINQVRNELRKEQRKALNREIGKMVK